MRRELHLNLFIHSRGHHEAAWRHPASSELALTDIEYYQGLAQRAEAALFDSIFFADQLALGGRLVIPVGTLAEQRLIVAVRNEHGIVENDLGRVRFVPLIGTGGWPEGSEPDIRTHPDPAP